MNNDDEDERVVLFFGAWSPDRPGHHIYNSHGGTADRRGTPWQIWELDTRLAPIDKAERQGRAQLHQRHGWTAIAFWDRTGDSRAKSNSVVLVNQLLTFTEMLSAFKSIFPAQYNRVNGDQISLVA